MLTKGGENQKKNKDDDDDCSVTPDSTTEPPRPAHDFQEGDDVFFHTEEGQHILGTIGQITTARCQILFGDGTEQWAPFVRIKKLSCSFNEEGPSPPSNNVGNNFPSRSEHTKADVVCVICKNIKKMSPRKARLFTANLPFKCTRCTSSQQNAAAVVASSVIPNHTSHYTPTSFQKKPTSMPRELLRHIQTADSSQQQQNFQIGDSRQSQTGVNSSASQYLNPTSSFASSLKPLSSLSSNPSMVTYRSSLIPPTHPQPPKQQHNSIGSTNNILNPSGSMTIKPIRTVQVSNPKTGTTTSSSNAATISRTLCFHCGTRTHVYDRVHCNMCERYCHLSCLPSVTPPAMDGDKFWDVMCSACGTQNESEKGGSKVFSCRRNISSWSDVVNLIINCLQAKSLGQEHFDFEVEILPFFENYIDRLHLPRQYKSASLEDRKSNLLTALKNQRFREVKQPGSRWALSGPQSSPIATSSIANSTSLIMNPNIKSKIDGNQQQSLTTNTIVRNNININNSNIISNVNQNHSTDRRNLFLNQIGSTTTITPNYNNISHKKHAVPYNTARSSSSPSSSYEIKSRPKNLTLMPNPPQIVNQQLVSPSSNTNSSPTLPSKSKNIPIASTACSKSSIPFNSASSPICDMSASSKNKNNFSPSNMVNAKSSSNSPTTNFPRVLSKEALLRNPPTISTNIILSPTKTSLSASSSRSGIPNNIESLTPSHHHPTSSSDCDNHKIIQGIHTYRNEPLSTVSAPDGNENKVLRNSPRKSLKLNQSQKEDPYISKPKTPSLVHKISPKASEVSSLHRQRLRLRTPTKADSITTTTSSPKSTSETDYTTTTTTNCSATPLQDGRLKQNDSGNCFSSSSPSSSSLSSKTIFPRSTSCTSILLGKRAHDEEDGSSDTKLSNDSTMVALVKSPTNVQNSNTIVVRATKIARMDSNTSPTPSPSPSTTSEIIQAAEIRPIGRPKLTRSSSLNIKNGKVSSLKTSKGLQQNDVGRVVRGRGRPLGRKGITSNLNSAKKEDMSLDNLMGNNNNNCSSTGKAFNPYNGLTDSLSNNIYATNIKLTRNGNNSNANNSSTPNGKLKKLQPNQNQNNNNDTLVDAENSRDDMAADSPLNTFSSNLLTAALFGGIKIQSLPPIPATRAEIREHQRKVGEYLLAEEPNKREAGSNNNPNNNSSNNEDMKINTDGTEGSRSSDNNFVKRLFPNSNGPSRHNFPEIKEIPIPNTPTVTTTADNYTSYNILNERKNGLIRNNVYIKNNISNVNKTNNNRNNKRNLEDTESYDILAVKVGDDGILRYEVVWWGEVSSDEEEEEEGDDDDEEVSSEKMEIDLVEEEPKHQQEVNEKQQVCVIGELPLLHNQNNEELSNQTKKIDVERRKHAKDEISTAVTPTQNESNLIGRDIVISIKSEEEMEARKKALEAIAMKSRPLSSSLMPSSSSSSFRNTNLENFTMNFNRKSFNLENAPEFLSIDDEDDQVQVLSTACSSKSNQRRKSPSLSSATIPDIIDLTTDSP